MNTTQQPPQPTPALSAADIDAIERDCWFAEGVYAYPHEPTVRALIAAARAYTALVPLGEAATEYRAAERALTADPANRLKARQRTQARLLLLLEANELAAALAEPRP